MLESILIILGRNLNPFPSSSRTQFGSRPKQHLRNVPREAGQNGISRWTLDPGPWPLLIVLSMTLWMTVSAAADIVDRLRAVVNGEVITQGDINQQLSLRKVSRSLPPNLSPQEVEQLILDQLVDQKLLLQEMKQAPSVSSSEIDHEINALRTLYASPQEFKAALEEQKLTMEKLRALIELRLRILKFAKEHFRPEVTITDEQVEDYYRNTYVPQVKKSGSKDIPPLSQVAGEIRELLTEAAINEKLDTFLRQRRKAANIKIL